MPASSISRRVSARITRRCAKPSRRTGRFEEIEQRGEAADRALVDALQQGKDAGIADYNKVIQLNSDYTAAYNNRGITRYYARQWDAAIDDFRTALRLSPAFVGAHNGRRNS